MTAAAPAESPFGRLIERLVPAGLRRWADRVADALLDRPVLDMVRLLTILLLMLHGPGGWYVRYPIAILGVAGILYRGVRSSPSFWFVISAFVLTHVLASWASADNHKWLLGYWCVALWLVALAPEKHQLEALRTNGRMLIGLVFAFATFWKAISVDYMDTTFFEHELLNDSRFAAMTHYATGLPLADLSENRRLKTKLKKDRLGEGVDRVTLASNERVELLAAFVTWWTILIEGAIALVFLWPVRTRVISALASLSILVFAATTYASAPVLGFAWVVLIMGFAQCPDEMRKLRASFLLVLALMYLYRLKLIPMAEQIADHGFGEMVRLF